MNWLILFIISWFIVGLVSIILIHLHDMRGEEFDEDYFDSECIVISVIGILFGYVTILIYLYGILKEHKPFTKLFYWLANIGLKK